VINKGGPREVVRHKTDGFLWDTLEELKEYSMRLVNNPDLWIKLSEASVKRSREFDIGFFEQRVKDIFC
jgi:glycosyltransferase involved in cell wall biosynthesis